MGLHRPRILVVSRDRTGDVAADLLTVIDCEVEHSRVAGRAFQFEYDALIFDIDLPDTDAWTTVRMLCRLGLHPRHLILTSTAPTMVDRDRADRLGAILLGKPLALEAFTEAVRASLMSRIPEPLQPAGRREL